MLLIHFLPNTFGKDMDPLIPSSWINNIATVILQEWVSHKLIYEGSDAIKLTILLVVLYDISG